MQYKADAMQFLVDAIFFHTSHIDKFRFYITFVIRNSKNLLKYAFSNNTQDFLNIGHHNYYDFGNIYEYQTYREKYISQIPFIPPLVLGSRDGNNVIKIYDGGCG